MLTPYHPNSAQARSHPSQRRNSQHINQKLSTQRQRNERSDFFSSNTTDDILSRMMNHHANIFNEVENFQKKIFKHVDDMFGMFRMGEADDLFSSNPFSRNRQPLMQSEGPSYYISKTYTYKTKQDPNTGKKYAEKHFSKNYAMKGEDGTTLIERQEGYYNTGNNLQRIAEERRINHIGKKLVQERIKGQGGITRNIHYENMREEDVDRFDKHWDAQTEQLGFYRKYGNILGYSNNSAKNSGNYENEYIPQNNSRRQNQPSTPGTPSNAIVMDIPIHDQPQQFGRVRRSDIQPTPTNVRGIGLPGPNYNQAQNREQNNRPAVIPEHHYEPNHEEPRYQNPEPNLRNRPERAPGQRLQNGNLRSDGNFKNKNVLSGMPMAG